jgi:hypothetical protein
MIALPKNETDTVFARTGKTDVGAAKSKSQLSCICRKTTTRPAESSSRNDSTKSFSNVDVPFASNVADGTT